MPTKLFQGANAFTTPVGQLFLLPAKLETGTPLVVGIVMFPVSLP